MVKEKVIAIIPARGGSKRIPQKNIIDFHGKPLIAWTIEAAQKSQIFDKIFVSTDDQEIANIAQQYGACIPFLREKHNDDYSNISMVTIHALEQIEKNLNEKYDIVIQLMPNCPIRKDIDIISAYKNFLNNKNLFQLSCFKFGWMNPWWAIKLKSNNNYEYLFPNALKQRSQDLENLYCPTGAIWIARTKDLIQQKTFYGNPLTFFPINWKSAIDIDDYEDLEMAKALFSLDKSNNNLFKSINNIKNIASF